MDTIDATLNEATKRLIAQFARMMESAGTNPDRIAALRARSETTCFPVDWPLLLEELQHSLYDTAYSRYCHWLGKHSSLASEESKRKATTVDSDLANKRATPSRAESPKIPQTATQKRRKKRNKKSSK